MDKKDIYEHLAKIYLDASANKKSKSSHRFKALKNIIAVSVVFLFAFGIGVFTTFSKLKPFESETALVLLPEAAKINFYFDPAKKEIFSLNLNNLDLNKFKALAFSVKNINRKDSISLRVEFTSAFKEKSEVYLWNIPVKWYDYKINFSEFKNISDWSEMRNLVFAVEEWNAKEKKGVVYLDNIRVLK
ncbi:MAG: hypothetical protein WC628_06385 [Candidatus Omnitrophota bacterium]